MSSIRGECGLGCVCVWVCMRVCVRRDRSLLEVHISTQRPTSKQKKQKMSPKRFSSHEIRLLPISSRFFSPFRLLFLLFVCFYVECHLFVEWWCTTLTYLRRAQTFKVNVMMNRQWIMDNTYRWCFMARRDVFWQSLSVHGFRLHLNVMAD